MKTIARTVVLLLLAALPAAAQDPAPPEKPRRIHPLRLQIQEMRAQKSLAAARRLHTVEMAQASFQAAAYVDVDRDGIGEHGSLQELAGLLPPRASADGTQHEEIGTVDVTDMEFPPVNAAGELVADGYVFRVFLPGPGGLGVAESAGRSVAEGATVDSNLAEEHWCCYAWPLTASPLKPLTMFVNDRGEAYATTSAAYVGEGHGPQATAAFAPSDGPDAGLAGALAAGAVGRDGNTWQPIGDALKGLAAVPTEHPDSPWRDEKLLNELLDAACTEVETLCGASFEGRRPQLRISTFDQVGAVLQGEIGHILDAQGVMGLRGRPAADAVAAGMLAKYAFEDGSIHVLPETAELMAVATGEPGLLDVGVVRVILVHEATHALDARRHPLRERLLACVDNDAMMAHGAVVEGHAQFVARTFARRADLVASFDCYGRALSWRPDAESGGQAALMQAFMAFTTFPYVKGLGFFDAVHAARGKAGVDEVFARPPQTTREIERPTVWLDPPAAAKVSLDALLAPFESLAPDEWADVRTPLMASALLPMFQRVPEGSPDEVLDLLVEAKALVSTHPAGTSQILVAVMRMDSPEAAARMVALERALSELNDRESPVPGVEVVEATYTEGVGPEGSLAGFHCAKTVSVPGQDISVAIEACRIGAYVFELTLTNCDGVTPEMKNAALAAAAALLSE